jgi:prepilin-type N-terminal cleavage/methylation domain-containing protein
MGKERTSSSGFTLIEVITVVAIVGVLALIAYPNMVRFKDQQQTRAGATHMAGVLDEARSRATSEATPYLVYFNDDAGGGGDGTCAPAATMVRDSDRTYTITPGDEVRDIALPEDSCRKIKKVDEASTASMPELRLPLEDVSTRALDVIGLGGLGGEGEGEGESGEGESGEGKSGSGKSTVSEARVVDAVVKGATFPIDDASGRPVIAFSERGIPVDPQNPTNWGSGAGAIYMTDGKNAVYAAVVQPLGNVQLRMFDNVSGEWR